jgi:hypothetical protein
VSLELKKLQLSTVEEMSTFFSRSSNAFKFYDDSEELLQFPTITRGDGNLIVKVRRTCSPFTYKFYEGKYRVYKLVWNSVLKMWKISFPPTGGGRNNTVIYIGYWDLVWGMERVERIKNRTVMLLASRRPDNPVGRAFSSPLGDINVLRELLKEWT